MGKPMFMNKGLRFIFDKNYRFLINASFGKYDSMSDEEFLKKKFKAKLGRDLDLENPKSYNEKLQWLKLYNRKKEYIDMVDKYKVRDYVADKLSEDYLIPLIGVWDSVDDIDFDKLPNEFVLKCNHNSGLGMCICKDKASLDFNNVKKKLKKGLEQNYYLSGREWPYKEVERKIICEKYMVDDTYNELRDYKFYCFDGEVKFVMINSDRMSDEKTKADYFDKAYNKLDFIWGYSVSDITPEKPRNFEKMIECAEILSENIPHVRVDFYDCNNKIYFGEMTFFDGSGFERIEPLDWDYRIGAYLDLNKIENGG